MFAVLSMLSIGILGILSKIAERRYGNPLNTALTLFGGSALIMSGYVAVIQRASLVPPRAVGGYAVFFGALAILALWTFLYGLQFGKITTSWIFMNLSAVIPAALSTTIYNEKINFVKAAALGFVVISIILLWKDKQVESEEQETHGPGNGKIWLVAMLSAFLLNGVCPFGLRILSDRGLAHQYTAVYLVYWYLAGFVFGLVGLIKVRQRISLLNFGIGLLMSAASVGGQFFMGLALSNGAPGSVVYMLSMGASLCIVVLGGVLFLGETVGFYAKVGIAVGLTAAVLLGTGG